jgi:hypothetical protein
VPFLGAEENDMCAACLRTARVWLWLLTAVATAACNGGDGRGQADGAVVGDGGAGGDGAALGDGGARADASPAWYQPDPQGRTTEGNLRGTEPQMLLVTSEALRSAWEAYADHRTLGGVLTGLATIEELRTAYPAADDAASLRAALAARRQAGQLQFVLLGGDAQHVPFRRVSFGINVPGSGSYYTDGPAELYFADLDTSWDADGDGKYGEKTADITVAQMRAPELAVGRVPASNADEIANYLAKAETYELEPAGRATYPLLLSDVASNVPVLGDIDAAEGIEPTVSQLFPAAFKSHAQRLYATSAAAGTYGGTVLTAANVALALNDGYSLVFHQGHGSHDQLTAALSLQWVNGLANQLPPVVLSCSCLSGNFADVANSSDNLDWTEQGPDDDSAGERLIVGPRGSVAYVGNTATGLGPIGGSQFLHALLEGLFTKGQQRLGTAFGYAHTRMRQISLSMKGVPMPQTDDSEFWTHLAVILLGDPALPVWTAEPGVLALDAPASYGPGFNELTVTAASGGSPLAGATVTAVKHGDFVLRGTTDAQGRVTFRFLPYGPAPITIQATATGLVPSRVSLAPLH